MVHTICFLVYGDRREYQLELTYAVASIERFIGHDRTAWRVVLITDEAHPRPDLPIEHLFFSGDEFARWTQDGRYHHGAKVHALMKAVQHFGGKVALIDTDTYLQAPPSRLFELIGPGKATMQAVEGPLGALAEWLPLLQRAGGTVAGYRVDHESVMMNSGVVGIDASDGHRLPNVLSLMEKLYSLQPLFNIEQFAVTAVLGRDTTLVACPELVAHYWGYERRFVHAHVGALFPSFTRERFEQLVASFIPIGYAKKTRLNQLRARLKTWVRRQGGQYRFAYLAYRSALSCVPARPVDADAWARIAVDALQQTRLPLRMVEEDFSGMRDEENLQWMSAGTRAAWTAYWKARADASSAPATAESA